MEQYNVKIGSISDVTHDVLQIVTEKPPGFQQKYLRELKNNKDKVAVLKEQIKRGLVTLVYAAKDEEHNEALVLKEWLSK